jgi:hypothetical protein
MDPKDFKYGTPLLSEYHRTEADFGQATGPTDALLLPQGRKDRRIYTTQFTHDSGLAGTPVVARIVDRGTINNQKRQFYDDGRLTLPLWRLPNGGWNRVGGSQGLYGSVDTGWHGLPTDTFVPAYLGAVDEPHPPLLSMFSWWPHAWPESDPTAIDPAKDSADVDDWNGLFFKLTTGNNFPCGPLPVYNEAGNFEGYDAFSNPLGPESGIRSWLYQMRHRTPVATHFDAGEFRQVNFAANVFKVKHGRNQYYPTWEPAFVPYGFSLEFGIPATVLRHYNYPRTGGDKFRVKNASGTVIGYTSQLNGVSGCNNGFTVEFNLSGNWVQMGPSVASLAEWARAAAFDEYHLRGFMSYGGKPWLLPWNRGRISGERFGELTASATFDAGHYGSASETGFAMGPFDFSVPHYVNGWRRVPSTAYPHMRTPLPGSYWVGGHNTDHYSATVGFGNDDDDELEFTATRWAVDRDPRTIRVVAASPTDAVKLQAVGYLRHSIPIHQPLVVTESTSDTALGASGQGNTKTQYMGEFIPGSDAGEFFQQDEHADYETFLHMRQPSERPRGLRDFKIYRVRDVTLNSRRDNDTSVSMKRRSWYWKINEVVTFDNEESWSLDKAFMVHTFGSSTRTSAATQVEWIYRDIDEPGWNSDTYVSQWEAKDEIPFD